MSSSGHPSGWSSRARDRAWIGSVGGGGALNGSTSNAQIEKAALALPDQDRAELALKLLDSLSQVDPAVSTDEAWCQAWAPELQRRMSAVTDGRDPLVDADDVFAELEEELIAR